MLLGIGDDGAVLDLKALDNENLVMSTDTLVENAFPSSINAGLIAKRALCTNLSDTAAMGAVHFGSRFFDFARREYHHCLVN